MRSLLFLLTAFATFGCASSRHDGMKVIMEFYPGTVGMVTLPRSTLTQLEELLNILPREKDETPIYTQGVWLKPNLPPASRAYAEKAEAERQQRPPAKMKPPPTSFRPLQGELIAEISVYPTESAEPEALDAFTYKIYSDGIRSYPGRFLWRLNASSLERLKEILNAGIQVPNQSPEPTPDGVAHR